MVPLPSYVGSQLSVSVSLGGHGTPNLVQFHEAFPEPIDLILVDLCDNVLAWVCVVGALMRHEQFELWVMLSKAREMVVPRERP